MQNGKLAGSHLQVRALLGNAGLALLVGYLQRSQLSLCTVPGRLSSLHTSHICTSSLLKAPLRLSICTC